MNLSRDYEVIDFMRKPILRKLDSLHQLQNIYFLLKDRELQFANKLEQTPSDVIEKEEPAGRKYIY